MKEPDTIPHVGSLPTGLAQPAVRALQQAGIHNLEQLSQWHERQVRQLHGIGPNAFEKLSQALQKIGLNFRPE
jgi:hypothetical protein